IQERKRRLAVQMIDPGATPGESEIRLRAGVFVHISRGEAGGVRGGGGAQAAFRKQTRDGSRGLRFIDTGEDSGSERLAEVLAVGERIQNAFLQKDVRVDESDAARDAAVFREAIGHR